MQQGLVSVHTSFGAGAHHDVSYGSTLAAWLATWPVLLAVLVVQSVPAKGLTHAVPCKSRQQLVVACMMQGMREEVHKMQDEDGSSAKH